MNVFLKIAGFCGFDANATNSERYLSSPGYPGKYPSSANCLWNIISPPGAKLLLRIFDFHTEFRRDALVVRIII